MNALLTRTVKTILAAALITTSVAPHAMAFNAGLSKDLWSRRSQAAYMRSSEPTLAPMSWVRFCIANAGQCQGGGGDDTVTLTPDKRAAMEAVNRTVNGSIRAVNYADLNAHRWSVAPTEGNCNDYAVTKRAELLRQGFPAGALRMAVARTRWGEGHTVLVVRTDSGDLVMDSLRGAILPWRQTGLRWISVQSSANPGLWFRT